MKIKELKEILAKLGESYDECEVRFEQEDYKEFCWDDGDTVVMHCECKINSFMVYDGSVVFSDKEQDEDFDMDEYIEYFL